MKNTSKVKANKKQINLVLIIVGICFVLGVSIGTIFGIIAKNTLDIAFYNVDQEYSQAIQEKISQSYSKKVHFANLDEQSFNAKKIAKKYDLVIGWDGNCINELIPSSKKLPKELFSSIPFVQYGAYYKDNLFGLDRENKVLPLLLNHYEVAYNKDYKSQLKADFPQNINEYLSYLAKLKNVVFSPFFAGAGDDSILLGYLSLMIESFGGVDCYNSFVDAVNKDLSFEELLEFPLKAQDGYDFNLKVILDGAIKSVQLGFIHPMWYGGFLEDVERFGEQKQIGILMNSLSNHRKIDSRIMNMFVSERMPVRSLNDSHGLIAPSLVCVKLSKSNKVDSILENLVSLDSQTYLSDVTKLAPVHSQAIPYDSLSNDVRYMACAVPGGPLPDLYNSCFQNKQSKKDDFCRQIRFYLEAGNSK